MNKLQFLSRVSMYLGIGLVLLAGCSKDPSKPTAGFDYSIDESGLIVTFINQSTDASTYVWDFGDGSATSTLAAPTHTYADFQTYQVKLTATGEGGTAEITMAVELPVVEPIAVDGDFADWADVPNFYDFPDGEGRTLLQAKVIDSKDYLYFYVKGTSSIGEVLQIFVDADNDGATGWGYWNFYETPGLEYVMEAVVANFPGQENISSGLQTATNAENPDWPWQPFVAADAITESSGYVAVTGGKAIEFSLLKDMFSNPYLGSEIRIVIRNSDNTWTNVGGLPIQETEPRTAPAVYTMLK